MSAVAGMNTAVARDLALARLQEEFPRDLARAGAEPLITSEVSAVAEGDRTRVKLQLWRLRSIIEVELNAVSGELIAWRDPGLARERGGRRVSEAEAIDTARAAVAPLPVDAGSPDVYLKTIGDQSYHEVTWVHLVGPLGDVVVEGDRILVRVNATTGKVQSLFRKWRAVRETPAAE